MRRACKVTLKFVTAKKRRTIVALLEAYRAAVNFYIRSLWVDRGSLDKATLARLTVTRLSERYKSRALKQALEIVVATKKSAKALGKPVSCPVFRGSAILDAKFVSVEAGKGSFDLIVRLSSLHSRHRITIPTKRTAVLNRWTRRGTIVQGCALNETSIVLWVDVIDKQPKTIDRTLGLDIGINKLLSTSDGQHYGIEFKVISGKIRRSKPKSKARYRHYAERENYINRTINLLPWKSISVVGIEALNDMKRGKHPKRGKAFRKAITPWTYRRVLERIGHKAQENRVHLVAVPSAYTSQTCPECGRCEKENRSGENFTCVGCGHAGDVDYVGARNVLARTLETLRSVESLGLNKAMQ
jgi:IS605 OrfB family transposase